MSYTKEQILDEVKRIHSGELARYDSEVLDAWSDMALDWWQNDDGAYLMDGFTGFNDRTPEQIVADFHFAGKLTEALTDEEVELFTKEAKP